MDIQEFKKKFDDEYDFLDSLHDRVAGFRDAVTYFYEHILYEHREFVREFVKYRGRAIASEREAGAFTFAFFDIIDQEGRSH